MVKSEGEGTLGMSLETKKSLGQRCTLSPLLLDLLVVDLEGAMKERVAGVCG